MIYTDRLVLRKWKIEDAEAMFKYASDKAISNPCGWKTHQSLEESQKVVDDFIANHPYNFAICLKEDEDNPIGCIELMANSKLIQGEGELELGYWLGKPFWGRGYMPEACKAIIKYGFEELNLNTIWCSYYEGNNQSKRVQEKLGFEYISKTSLQYVQALNDYRVSHTLKLTKEKWLSKNA